MMKILPPALLLLLTLNSCHHRAIVASQSSRDSTFTSQDTIRRDSAFISKVPIFAPPVIITIHDTIPCPEAEVHSEEKQGNLTATLDIHKGKVIFKCKEDELRDSIAVLNHERTTLIREKMNRTKEEVKTVERPYEHIATKIDKFCYWFTGIGCIALLIWLFIKFRPSIKLGS